MSIGRRARFAVAVAVILLIGGMFTMAAYRRQQQQESNLEKLTHDGLERTYLVHVGKAVNPNAPAPLVLLFHGGGGEATGMAKLTHFDRIADREGLIALYPNGVKKHWNDGRGTVNPDIDDIGFISALIDFMVEKRNADPARVYVTGISNGGMFSHRVAFELGAKVAAAAPVAGSIPVNIALKGSPARPVPLLMLHGTEDTLVPYAGGEVAWNGGTVLSVPEAASRWATWDNCTQPPDVDYLPDKANDTMKVRQESYANGTVGSEVLLLTIEGGGHTWPGGWQYMSERIIGKTCRDIDASEMLWQFFEKHPRA